VQVSFFFTAIAHIAENQYHWGSNVTAKIY